MSEKQETIEPKKEETKTEEKKKPRVFRMGCVKLTEWTNEKDGNVFKSVVFTKVYTAGKDEAGKTIWKETSSFNEYDVNKLRMLVNEYISFLNPMKTD